MGIGYYFLFFLAKGVFASLELGQIFFFLVVDEVEKVHNFCFLFASLKTEKTRLG